MGSGLGDILWVHGDEERLRGTLQDKWAINTARRMAGKGLGPWREFLRSRGLSEEAHERCIFMEGEGVTDQDRLRLLALYAVHLKEKGLNPKDYFQALRGDFLDNYRPIAIFSDPRLMLARNVEYCWQARELNIRRENIQKLPVTFEMLLDMHVVEWRLYPWDERSTDGFDKGMTFAAGLVMYNWGLRVSEAAKTLSDRAYRDAGEH